jgi:hypothetical protein
VAVRHDRTHADDPPKATPCVPCAVSAWSQKLGQARKPVIPIRELSAVITTLALPTSAASARAAV